MGFFRPYRSQANYLELGLLTEIRREIESSPFLDATTLNERFGTTRGFSVTFTRPGKAKVARLWPAIDRFLDQTLDSDCNAFFLNPLVISQGSHVDAHIDCSLRAWTAPEDPPFPRKVSVLYVDVPPGLEGGDLLIYWLGMEKAFRPEVNLLVEFQGSLRHEVSPMREAQLPRPRVSLVCEQYAMEKDLLRLIPDFHLNSKCSFDDFLENALETPAVGNDGGTLSA